MKKLYPFQQAVVMRALQFCGVLFAAAGRGALIVAPTGAGKTVIAGHLIRVLAQFGLRTVFLAERKELLDQAVARFQEIGLRVGELRSGLERDLDAPVVVASKGVLANRLKSGRPLPDARLVVIDEAHRAFSAGWESLLLSGYPQAFRLGLTATPERLDGQGLERLFDRMIQVDVPISGLIEEGRLAPVRYVTPVNPREWEFAMCQGDFDVRAITKGMREMRYQIVGAWLNHASDRSRTAVFCASTTQADELAEEFRSKGVSAVAVHTKCTPAQREAALSGFERGEIKVLVSVDMFIEGIDLPEVDTVLLARPTMSLRVFLQSVGRGMRVKSDGRELLVLDCAGNVYRHGLPTWDRKWTLAPREVKADLAARRGKHRDDFVSCGACGTLREARQSKCDCGSTREAARKNGVLQSVRVRARKTPALGVDKGHDLNMSRELYGYAVGQGRPNALTWTVSVLRHFGADVTQDEVKELQPVKPSPATIGFLRDNRREIARLAV